ncbi:MAG TPA: hypothetical protein VKA15_07615 [Isosphaeraceae bacterium]|nr:hypothetical protein [Isosphaeraceae bacterium]
MRLRVSAWRRPETPSPIQVSWAPESVRELLIVPYDFEHMLMTLVKPVMVTLVPPLSGPSLVRLP